MTEITETPADLTPEWFTDALREGGTLGDESTVTGAACEKIGTGQLGSVIRAELTYGGVQGPETLIVKQPSTDEGSRGMGVAMGVYRSEVRFYEQVAQMVDTSVPRMHWGALEEATGRFTLVLDDLSGHAQVGDMLAGATPAQIESALAQTAHLQSPLWDDPRATELDWLGDLSGTRMLFGAVPTAVEPFQERYGDRVSAEHLELVRRLAPRAPEVVDAVWKPPFVVAHGDYRLDNMLFDADGNATIIDWQACRLAPPGLDHAIFLSTCVDPNVRRATERELMGRHAEAVGQPGFGPEEMWASYSACALYPFLLCVFTSITLEQTERGDAMWTRLLTGAAELVIETGSERVLGP